MRTIGNSKSKRQVESILLVCVLVAASMVIMFPLTAPKVRAQVTHLASAAAEDAAGAPYDTTAPDDGVVVWDQDVDHIISDPMGYTIEADMTLNIPALNYFFGDPDEHEITVQGLGTKIDVYGTLITNMGSLIPRTYTAFLGGTFLGFDGIYFHSGSKGCIVSTLIRDAANGVVFEPGSTLMSPGVEYSMFERIGAYGMRMDGALGYTDMHTVQFDDGTISSAIGLDVANGSLNMRDVFFLGHGIGLPSLHISNASVHAEGTRFNGYSQPGNVVLIEGSSNGTILDQCDFLDGAAGDHFVRVDASTVLMENCSFDTSGGELSVIANEDALYVPAHVIIRQPTADGVPGFWDDTFDNSTMNATGNSSVTLQWYMDVHAEDPDGNPIDNAHVAVKDRNRDPAEPPSKTTDASGWARGFIVTELVQYSIGVINYNPFNVSATNGSAEGYAYPEPTMNMSKEVNVIVAFPTTPNTLPIVSWLPTPRGIQSGDITIEYRLSDPDPWDNGNMSIEVFFRKSFFDHWWPATQAGGNATTMLRNNTTYIFIWDSLTDLGNIIITVYGIKIVPSDRNEEGISNQTGSFTVDNKAPELVAGPFVKVTDTTALIEWTVDEPANASVRYGLNPTLTDEEFENSSSTFQSITLKGLQPGRSYTYIISSTALDGDKFSSTTYTFETEIHIQLYKGWNMISVPPLLASDLLDDVLASIAAEWDIVQWYDASDRRDPWKINHTRLPFGNDLTHINETMGFWIHMINDAVLIPDRTDPSTDPMFPGVWIRLYKGWNFVGYPSVTITPIGDALAGVPYDMVQTYDAATGQWLSFDGSLGNLRVMEMGRGYWIHCSAIHTWEVPYL